MLDTHAAAAFRPDKRDSIHRYKISTPSQEKKLKATSSARDRWPAPSTTLQQQKESAPSWPPRNKPRNRGWESRLNHQATPCVTLLSLSGATLPERRCSSTSLISPQRLVSCLGQCSTEGETKTKASYQNMKPSALSLPHLRLNLRPDRKGWGPSLSTQSYAKSLKRQDTTTPSTGTRLRTK